MYNVAQVHVILCEVVAFVVPAIFGLDIHVIILSHFPRLQNEAFHPQFCILIGTLYQTEILLLQKLTFCAQAQVRFQSNFLHAHQILRDNLLNF